MKKRALFIILATFSSLFITSCGENDHTSHPVKSEPESIPTSEKEPEPSSEISTEVDTSIYIEPSEDSSEDISEQISSEECLEHYGYEMGFDEYYHWKICDNCGQPFDRTEHNWYEGDFENKGNGDRLYYYYCTDCDAYRTEFRHVHEEDYSRYVDLGEEGHAHPYSCGHEGHGEVSNHVYYNGGVYDINGNCTRICDYCGHEEVIEPTEDDIVSTDEITGRVSGGKFYITGLTESGKNKRILNIPSTINNYPVEGIDANADLHSYSIKVLTFEEGIKTIGVASINDLYNLTAPLYFPDSLEYIYSNLPNYVEEVRLGKNLKVFNHNSWDYIDTLIYGCEDLQHAESRYMGIKNLIVEDGVTNIVDGFFSDYSLEKLTLPDSMLNIGNNFNHYHSYEENNVAYISTANNKYFAAMNLCNGDAYNFSRVINNNTKFIGENLTSYMANTNYGRWTLPDDIQIIQSSDNYQTLYRNIPENYNFDEVGGGIYIGSENNPYLVLVSYQSGFEKIVVHEDCKVIAQRALADCYLHIELNDGLRSICRGGLAYINLNYELVIPDSVSYLEPMAIASASYISKESGGKLVLGSGLKTIPEYSINITGEVVFNENTKYIKSITVETDRLEIPSGVSVLGIANGDIKNLIVPRTVKELTFEGARIENFIYEGYLDQYFDINKTVHGIRDNKIMTNLYADTSYLVNTVYLQSMKTLKKYDLYGIASVQELIFTDVLTSWDREAIGYLKGLKKVRIIGEGLDTFEKYQYYSLVPENQEWKLYLNDEEVKTLNVTPEVLFKSGFSYCESIKSIKINNEIEGCTLSSGTNNPFYYLTHLETLIVEDGTREIPNYLLCDNASVKYCVFPESLTRIGDCAFLNCTNFEGSSTFIGQINFEVNPITIGNNAFNNTSVLGVTINKGSIGSYAFANNGSLVSVVLGVGVTTVGSRAFYNNKNVVVRSFKPTNDYEGYASNWYENPNFPALTYYTGTATDLYGSRDLDGTGHEKYTARYYTTKKSETALTEAYLYSFSNVVDHEFKEVEIHHCYSQITTTRTEAFVVRGICPNAFTNANTDNIISVTISSSVRYVGNGALSGLSHLQYLNIENSLDSVSRLFNATKKDGYYKTSNNNYVPKTLHYVSTNARSFGDDAFTDLWSIKTLVLNNNGKSIEASSSSFTGTDIKIISYQKDNDESCNLDSLTPGSTSLYGIASRAEQILTEDQYQKSYYKIDDSGDFLLKVSADEENKEATIISYLGVATTLSIPSTLEIDDVSYDVVSIGEAAFKELDLVSVSIANSVKIIDKESFEGCTNLENISLPSQLESIGDYAFDGCSKLDNISLPNGLISIGKYAFNECKSLFKLTIPETVTSIDAYAFSNTNLYRVIFEGEDGGKLVTSNNPFESTPIVEIIIANKTNLPLSIRNFYGIEFLTSLDASNITYYDNGCIGYSGILYYAPEVAILYIPSDIQYVRNINVITNYDYSIIDFPSGFTFKEANKPDDYTKYSLSQNEIMSIASKMNKVVENGVIYLGNSANPYLLLYSGKDCDLETYTINENCHYIAEKAFMDNETLTKVVIKNNVIEIREQAFQNCSALKAVEIENGVSIGNGILYRSDNIEELTVPGEFNAYYAFSNKAPESLKTVRIAEGTTLIAMDAFVGCSSITEIYFPDSLEEIGVSAFEGCTGLLEIVIPDNVVKLYATSFRNCSNVKTITLSNSLTSIADSVFVGCTSVETLIMSTLPKYSNGTEFAHLFGAGYNQSAENVVPSSLKEIIIREGVVDWVSSLANCKSLERVVFPSTIKTISSSVLYGSTNLKEVVLPEGITSIGYSFLENCSSIERVTLPSTLEGISGNFFKNSGLKELVISKNITSIGSDVFQGCNNLEVVYYNGTIEDWCNVSLSSPYSNPMSITNNVYFLDQDGDVEYNGNHYSKIKDTLIIPDSVEEIKQYQFAYVESTEIIIPNTVTTIEQFAFYGTNPTKMTVPFVGTVSGRSDYTGYLGLIFGSSSQNKNDNVPTSLKELVVNGGYLMGTSLNNCSSIEVLTINQAELIYYGSLKGCTSLKVLSIPTMDFIREGYVREYPLGALFNTSTNGTTQHYISYSSAYTENYDIPSSLVEVHLTGEVINSYAFENMTYLKEVTISKEVTMIPAYCFSKCTSLEAVNIPSDSKLTSIEYMVFYDCSKLTTIEIPSSLDTLGEYCLYNCTSLNYNYYEGVKYLGSEASPYVILCGVEDNTMSTLNIHENTKIILGGAFQGLTNIESVTLPEGITTISSQLFQGCSSLKSVIIPDSVTLIEYYAFTNCSNLESIVLPSSVRKIESNVFYGCSKLENIYYKGTLTEFVSINFNTDKGSNPMTANSETKLYLLDENGDVEFNGDHYSSLTETVIVEDGTTYIGPYAFYNLKVKNVVLPQSITKIDRHAFNACTTLENVYYDGTILDWIKIEFGNELANPMYYAKAYYLLDESGEVEFNNKKYTYLTELVIPEGITSMKSYTFYNFNQLHSITVCSTYRYNGTNTFQNCGRVVEVINNSTYSSVTSYGGPAYNRMSVHTGESLLATDENGFVTLTLNDKVYLVDYLGHDENVVIPTVDVIKSSAIYNKEEITSITIPSGVSEVQNGFETGCPNIQYIYWPNTVTTHPNYPIFDYKNLVLIIFDGTKAEFDSQYGKYFRFTGTSNYIHLKCSDSETIYDVR